MKYKRILLKLSGEALSGDTGHGINAEVLSTISEEVKELKLSESEDEHIVMEEEIVMAEPEKVEDEKDKEIDEIEKDAVFSHLQENGYGQYIPE